MPIAVVTHRDLFANGGTLGGRCSALGGGTLER